MKRKIIGIILLCAAVISCISGLLSLRTGTRISGTATGRDGSFVRPAAPDGTVSVNFGDAEELARLPGIGDYTAQAILEERETNGLFHYAEDLMAVKGIGPSRLAKIRPLLDLSEE